MRNHIALFAVAFALTMCGPAAPPKVAVAHPIGRVCVYTDVDGYRATDYCHHLRVGQPAEVYLGLPGLRMGFGGGGGMHLGLGGGRQWRQDHGWGGGWRHGQMNPAPGAQIQLNFGGGGGHHHGNRP